MNAGVYCRISKDSQGQGLGIERQESLCRKLAEDKGWQVSQVYADNDISAYAGKARPRYEAMLADMASGAIKAVVCVDLDRLTRHPAELEDFIAIADSHGIALANVSGEIDLSTSDGRMNARIRGAFARHESEKKSERIRRQKDQAAAKGWAHGGRRPYGFRYTRTPEGNSTLEIVQSEARTIREMADMLLNGASTRTVANTFNDRGVPTVTGSTWKQGTIRNLLSNPSLAGLRQHRGKVVGTAAWGPILDRVTWERLQAVLGAVRQPKRGRPPVHLLSGLLTCSKCGGKLAYSSKRAASGNMVGRYGCPARPQGCAGIAVSSEQAEELVLTAMKGALDTPEMAAVLESEPESDSLALGAEIEAVEARLEALSRDYYVEARISEREYVAARTGLDEKLTELQSQLAPRGPLGGGMSLTELWEGADNEAYRAIFSELIESAVVLPGVRGRRTLDPERIQINWRAERRLLEAEGCR